MHNTILQRVKKFLNVKLIKHMEGLMGEHGGRTWGDSSKFDGEELELIHGGNMGGGLKMLSRNTCVGVNLLVKLLTISLHIY